MWIASNHMARGVSESRSCCLVVVGAVVVVVMVLLQPAFILGCRSSPLVKQQAPHWVGYRGCGCMALHAGPGSDARLLITHQSRLGWARQPALLMRQLQQGLAPRPPLHSTPLTPPMVEPCSLRHSPSGPHCQTRLPLPCALGWASFEMRLCQGRLPQLQGCSAWGHSRLHGLKVCSTGGCSRARLWWWWWWWCMGCSR